VKRIIFLNIDGPTLMPTTGLGFGAPMGVVAGMGGQQSTTQQQGNWYPSPTDRLSTSDNEFSTINTSQTSPPGRMQQYARPGSLRLNLPPGLDAVDGGSIVEDGEQDEDRGGQGGDEEEDGESPVSPPLPSVPPPMATLGTTAMTGTLPRNYLRPLMSGNS
jgi:hypothetical protein